LKILHSLTFSAKMLREIIHRDSITSYNDKIDLKNKLNVGKCKIFECRESKSVRYIHNFVLT
jgi:hypothetical protein